MKAQMFVITMVFLVGLVFAVQGILSQYGFVDLAKAFEKNHAPLLSSIKNSFNSTLQSSPCSELDSNLKELELFLENKIVEGTTIELSYSHSCIPPNLNLTIHLKTIEADTTETVVLP